MHNICFNERQNILTTRYDWIPLISENIEDTFFSIGGIQSLNDTNEKIWKHDCNTSDVTKWFNTQHYFEFEFVVSDPIGVHKVIDNLQIISNNVQPEQLTFEILGDAYMFNKEKIVHLGRADEVFESRIQSNLLNKTNKNIPKKIAVYTEKYDLSNWFRNISKVKHFDETIWNGVDTVTTTMIKDKRTKQYVIAIPQECRNIETWGRRLGNIYYKEDSWYTTVEPLIYDARLNDPKSDLSGNTTKWSSTRIRDKWCKIKVRYSGEDLAIITALITSINV